MVGWYPSKTVAQQQAAQAPDCLPLPPLHPPLQSPITFVAKHWTPDVFQDGSCVFSKPVAGGAGGSQERVLFTAGEQLRFGSVAEFAAALKLGGLGVVLGPEAVRSLASTLVAAQQTATQAQQTAREP